MWGPGSLLLLLLRGSLFVGGFRLCFRLGLGLGNGLGLCFDSRLLGGSFDFGLRLGLGLNRLLSLLGRSGLGFCRCLRSLFFGLLLRVRSGLLRRCFGGGLLLAAALRSFLLSFGGNCGAERSPSFALW